MRSQPQLSKGFTLVEIMIVVAILGLLLAIAIPNFRKARASAQAEICLDNLTQIEAAKQLFALERGRVNGDPVNTSDLIGPKLYLKTMPLCPAGGTYDLLAIGTNTTCSMGPDLKHRW